MEKKLEAMDGCDARDLAMVVDRTRLAATRRLFATHPMSGFEGCLAVVEDDVEEAFDGFVAASMYGVSQAGIGDSEHRLGWEDVGGMPDAITALRDALELVSIAAEWLEVAPLRLRTGLLLYGPPGCGKTHLVRLTCLTCSADLGRTQRAPMSFCSVSVPRSDARCPLLGCGLCR